MKYPWFVLGRSENSLRLLSIASDKAEGEKHLLERKGAAGCSDCVVIELRSAAQFAMELRLWFATFGIIGAEATDLVASFGQILGSCLEEIC